MQTHFTLADGNQEGQNRMIKAVFFDANGIIYYRQENNRYLNEFLQKYNLAIPPEEKLALDNNSLQDASLRGLISQEVLWNAILRTCGVSEMLWSEGRDAIHQDHGNITVFPGVIKTLSALKAHGYKVGIVTDAAVSKETKLAWFHEQGLDIHWDAYANSMDLRTRKPDVRIFNAALEEAGVSANEAAFVGHDAVELDGARHAGLSTVAFNYDPGVEADYYIDSFEELLNLPYFQKVG